jgi:hypothetical protein
LERAVLPILPPERLKQITAKVKALAADISVPRGCRDDFTIALSEVVVRAWHRRPISVSGNDVPDGVEELRELASSLLEKLEADEAAARWIVSCFDSGDQGDEAQAFERLREDLLLKPAAQLLGTIDTAKARQAEQSPPPKRGGQPKEKRRGFDLRFEAFAEDVFRSSHSAGVTLTVNRNAMAKYEGTFAKAIRALRWLVPAGVVPQNYPDEFPVRGLERIANKVLSDVAQQEKREEERRQNNAEPGVLG